MKSQNSDTSLRQSGQPHDPVDAASCRVGITTDIAFSRRGETPRQRLEDKVTFTAMERAYASDELFIQRMDTVKTSDRQVLTANTYFEGGNVLACYAGSYRFSFLGGKRTITLRPGMALVVYPGNTATVESSKGEGRLKYVIFGGTRVVDFLDSFGFYDRLVFSGDTQEKVFDQAVRESAENLPRALDYLRDALATFGQTLKTGPDRRLHAALRTIDRELRDGRANVKTVCALLDISRATLNRTFDAAGMGSPRDYIQARIAAQAVRLLVSTDLTVADIARKVGIDSPAYFTAFMRRQVGMTPSELRKKGLR